MADSSWDRVPRIQSHGGGMRIFNQICDKIHCFWKLWAIRTMNMAVTLWDQECMVGVKEHNVKYFLVTL
jgi:hypothetical protein